ncbi:hypothetical protein D9M70_533430 [compost metagenome]
MHGTHGGTAADKAVAFQGIGLDAFRQLRIRWGEASEQAHLGNDDAPEVPERNVQAPKWSTGNAGTQQKPFDPLLVVG